MKKVLEWLKNVVKCFLVAVGSTLGVLTVFGWVLENLEWHINYRMYRTLGSGAVLATAVVGTPIHEASHWLACKMFGFEVVDVELLRPVAYKWDGILGYVSYGINYNNPWQRLGCVFVGIAPMVFGAFFILLFLLLLKPEIFKKVREEIKKAPMYKGKKNSFGVLRAVFVGTFEGIKVKEKLGILRSIVAIYLAISIAMHMTISVADICNARFGLAELAVLFLVYSISMVSAKKDYGAIGAKVASWLTALLSVGLAADLLMFLIAHLF